MKPRSFLALLLLLVATATSGCWFKAPSGISNADTSESQACLLYREAQRAYLFAKTEDDLRAVVEEYGKVIELYPDSYYSFMARFARAQTYRFALSDYGNARSEFQLLLGGDCDDKIRHISQYLLANTLNFGLHDDEGAIREYQKFLEAYPASPLAKRASEELFAVSQVRQTNAQNSQALHQE